MLLRERTEGRCYLPHQMKATYYQQNVTVVTLDLLAEAVLVRLLYCGVSYSVTPSHAALNTSHLGKGTPSPSGQCICINYLIFFCVRDFPT